jgi:two-component system cell cycle sensor histidine kinase/response regulator CckA
MYQVATVSALPMESTRRDAIGSAAMQLLLVGADDDFSYLRDLLNTGDGHVDLDHAHSTDEALALAPAYDGPIDLMVTDVVMPQMGGAKLAADLASDRPDMKVLFVSGYAETTLQRHGEIDVTTRFLQKPFSLKAMARKIREVLDAEKASAAAAGSSR